MQRTASMYEIKSIEGKADSPDILPICWRPQSLPKPVRLVRPIDTSRARLHYRSAVARLVRKRSGRSGSLVASERVQMRKVTLGNLGNVFAAKDTNLKVHVGTRGKLSAACFQVVKVLVNDFFGANVLCNFEAVTLVGNELVGRGQVDTAVNRQCEQDNSRQARRKADKMGAGEGTY